MYVYVAIALAAAIASGVATWKVQDWRYDAKEAARLEQVREDRAVAEKASSAAGSTFEKKQAQIITKYVTVTETIDKIIERPIYKNVCIDEDGLKALNESIVTPAEVKQ